MNYKEKCEELERIIDELQSELNELTARNDSLEEALLNIKDELRWV